MTDFNVSTPLVTDAITGRNYANTALTGQWLSIGFGSLGTINLGDGLLRVQPWYVPCQLTLQNFAFEVTATGDATATFDGVIYSDNNGIPGNLIASASGAATTVGVISVPMAVTLTPGWYWVGGVLQGVTVNQPTFRCIFTLGAISGYLALYGMTLPAVGGALQGGCQASGVTGAIPSPWPNNPPSGANAVPRMFFQCA